MFRGPYGVMMTAQYIPHLSASFPWLADNEAAAVAESLPPPDESVSAATQMSELAAALDQVGLPPTSTLLLSLAGRGSKGTAVAIARGAARARFERASATTHYPQAQPAAVTPVPAAGISEAQVRQVAQAAVESMLAMMPSAFAGTAHDDRLLPLVESVAGEVRWLRSTIDTERQLRRYREAHGPLPEHQAPQGPATTEERRTVVQQLAHSLERDRFASHVGRVDIADGPEE